MIALVMQKGIGTGHLKNTFPVSPGRRSVRDLDCCFGQVIINFHTASGRLFDPHIVAGGGGSAPDGSYDVHITSVGAFDGASATFDFPDDLVGPCIGHTLTVRVTDGNGAGSPPGVHVVVCHAIDPATKAVVADCKFLVTVPASGLTAERALVVRWNCGTRQSSANPGGPWEDVEGAMLQFPPRFRLARRVQSQIECASARVQT